MNLELKEDGFKKKRENYRKYIREWNNRNTEDKQDVSKANGEYKSEMFVHTGSTR